MSSKESKTPTGANGPTSQIRRGTESIKLSSIQDYTSGEGHDQIHENEIGENQYMLPDDNEEEQDVELSASGPESYSGREDLQEGISQGNEQVIDDFASSEASGVNPSAAREVLTKLQAKVELYYKE